MILKNGIIEWSFHSGIFCNCGQVLVMRCQFIADSQTFIVLGKTGEFFVIRQLLPAGLHSKIGLTIGDNRLGGIAVLYNQIAGVAGQSDIGEFAFCARTDFDHFENILEMVFDGLTTVAASLLRAFQNRQEMAILGIIQHLSQWSCQPIFIAFFILLADAVESSVMFLGNAFISNSVLSGNISSSSYRIKRLSKKAFKDFIKIVHLFLNGVFYRL